MLLLTLAVCFTAALATTYSGPGYLPDRVYRYRYETTLYTGYSELKPQYEGKALRADVLVQRQSDYYVIQLEHPVLARGSEIHNIEEYDYEFHENPEFTEIVTKPFRVVYKDGQVYRYDVSRDEPEFSVNLKRGLLHILNLNFEQRDVVHHQAGDYLHRPEPDSAHYTVFEDGRGGRCETTYIIISEPYYRTPYYNNVLNVTKVRNYHNCIEDTFHEYNPLHGYVCEECESEQHDVLHKNSRYHYNLRGDRQTYIIEYAYTEGEFVYTPYTERGTTAYVYENRTLTLVEERESGDKIPLRTDVHSYYDLDFTYGHTHSYDEVIDLKEPHYYYDIYGEIVPVERAVELFADLVSQYESVDTATTLDEELPVRYAGLVRVLSAYSYDQIDQLYRAIEGKSEEYRQLFYDVLAATGTNPAFLYGVHLIRDERVSAEVAKYFIQTVVYHVKEPSESLLDEFYRLCDHPHVRRRYDLYSSCYLAFSGLVYQTCVADYEHHEEYRRHEHGHHERYDRHDRDDRRQRHHCTPERATKYLNYFVSHYEHTDNDYYEIAYLKVLGNSGLREAIRYLRPYILDEDERHHPLYYRVSAVWALRRIAENYPEEVFELLGPLYANVSEDYELRISAFSVFLTAHPSQYQVEAIAHSLYEEPSDQVASFVYSTFLYLENSTHPCHRTLSKYARYVLEVLDDYEPVHHDFDHAFNYYSSEYEKTYDYGGYTHFAYIPSNSSYIPRKLYLGFNDYVGGHSYNTFSLGFHSYGLDRYFDRIFGPKGLFKESSLFDFLGRRSPRDTSSVHQEVREVDEKLKIERREYEPVYGNIFLKYYGTEIDFFHFNETLFDHIFNDRHYLDFLEHDEHRHLLYRRFLLGSDKTFVYASESGVPLVYEVKQPIYFHYHNNEFKYELIPEPPKRGFYVPKQVKLHVDGHLVYDRVVQVYLEAVLPFSKAVFGTAAVSRAALNIPIKLDVTADLESHKFTYKYTPLIPHEIYRSYLVPFTYYATYKEVSAHNYVDVHRYYLYDEDVREEEHDYFQEYLGLGYRVDLHYNNIWNDKGSWAQFFHDSDLGEQLRYYFYQPHFHHYTFNVTLIGADSGATSEIEGSFNYNYYDLGDRLNQPHKSQLFEEGLDDYDGDQKWYTHVLSGELHGSGQRERRIKSELTYSYSSDYLYHKYHLYYDRTPFHSSESENFKVCSAGYVRYPAYDVKKHYQLDTLDVDHSVDAKVNVYFGKDCNSDKKIRIRGHFDRTEEQKRHEARREEPVTYERFNEYAYYYQRCLAERQHGRFYNSYCRYYLYLISELLKYDIDITYENLPESFRNLTYHLASHVRHLYYPYVDYDPYAKNPDNQVRIEVNASLHDPVVDVRVYKPHETTYYTHVHVEHLHPLNTYPSPDYSYLQEYFGFYDFPYCLVQKDEVRTFDNYTYGLPQIDCYKVIAKDCSPTEDFLVLGRKVSAGDYEKAVVAYFGKYKVEAVPEGGKIVVKVNDKPVSVTEKDTYYQYVTEGDRQVTVFFVSYNGHYYTLHSHPYGLTVDYDGRVIYVQLSPYYRGKLCGLCGDYDGDRHDDLRGPDGHIYHDTDAYGYSYAVEDDKCKVPEYERPATYHRREGCTVQRNRHIYYGSRNRKSCFTIRPLPRCAQGCVPTRYVKRTESFHCLSTKENYSRHLLQESEHRVLHEVRRKQEDHRAEVEYPESCHLPEY